jgi:prepilin-type N-terminal cleavage/methylation domain-containing protein
MKRLTDQSGFTLIEMLVGVSMMLVVLSATLTVLDVFQKDSRKDQIRNETQDSARTAIDLMSRDFRSAASLCGNTTGSTCTGTSSGALQRATSTDVVFQTVSPGVAFGPNDASNQEWVRYCLDSSGNIWREINAPQSGGALPAMPSTTACPGDTGSWSSQRKIMTNLTNTGSQPLFQYYNVSTNSGGSIISLPKSVEFDLFVKSNTTPNLTTEITGGVDLRNSLASPTATFNCTKTSGYVSCDASGSTDPNGQALNYTWYLTSGTSTACPPTSSNVSNSEVYSAGALSGTYSVALVVTDTAGLNNCSVTTYSF